MRDHNRGIIIGSTTYGKGTGQVVLPFTGDDGDVVKITSFRFYDVKGGSHQGYGVKPDIDLPDKFSAFQYFERNVRNYIPNDRITKKTYYTPLNPIPLNTLRDSALSRAKRNSYFAGELRKTAQLKASVKDGVFSVPLTLDGFKNLYEVFKDIQPVPASTLEGITVEMTAVDQQVSSIDQYSQVTYENLIKGVKSDFYIQEATKTLTEYIELKK